MFDVLGVRYYYDLIREYMYCIKKFYLYKCWLIVFINIMFYFQDFYLFRIDEVDILVIDEVDRMIEKSYFEEFIQILNYINR